MDFQRCRQETTDKIISVTENNKTFQIKNASLKTYNKIKVDGCLFTAGSSQERCDYLFEGMGSNTIEFVIYIELKGKNVNKAFSQLIATIDYCNQEHGNCIKHCFIVASRVPKLGTSIQKMKKALKVKYQSSLTVKTNKAEYQSL